MPNRARASQIRVPALVVVGGSDELRDYNRVLAGWWPDSRFVEIAGASHMEILRRGETLAALRAYLGR